VFGPFVLFSFGHCIVCPPSIYGFRLSLWYLQTLLKPGLYAIIYIQVFMVAVQ